MTDFKYHLAKCTGSFRKLTCPSCGRRQCFVPYVDENNEILDETVGRCDHESSCAYHLTPSQYFQQNPGARPQGDAWRQPPEWLKRRKPQSNVQLVPQTQPKGRISLMPLDLVKKSIRTDRPCNFLTILRSLFPEEKVQELAAMYRLGVTRKAEVVFYQFDGEGRCHAGKVVQYNPVTRKRVHDTGLDVDWLHHRMKKAGTLPESWAVDQCLFGAHLLDKKSRRLVILVEAEKTAVIGAGYLPQYTWVATGGKTQLGEKLNVLQGFKVMALPDADGYDYWKKYFEERPYLGIRVSDLIEREVSDEDREAQVDIADWLIRAYGNPNVSPVPPVSPPKQVEHPEQYANPVAREVAKYFPAEYMPEIAALIDDLDLELVAVHPPKKQFNPDQWL